MHEGTNVSSFWRCLPSRPSPGRCSDPGLAGGCSLLAHPSVVPGCSLPAPPASIPAHFGALDCTVLGRALVLVLILLQRAKPGPGLVFHRECFFPPQSDMSRFAGCCWLRMSPHMRCRGPRGTCSLSAAQAGKSQAGETAQPGSAQALPLQVPTGKESGPEVLAENPTATKTHGGKKTQSLEPRKGSDKELLYSWGLAYQLLLPPFFFFFSNANPIHFLEPPIRYLFTQVEGTLPAGQAGAPRASSPLHWSPSGTSHTCGTPSAPLCGISCSVPVAPAATRTPPASSQPRSWPRPSAAPPGRRT